MYSKIYQIASGPIPKENYITASDFHNHWFTNSFSDYVDGDADRPGSLEWLCKTLEGIAVFGSKESFSILPGGKEKYFADAYRDFTEGFSKLMKLGFPEFISGGDYSFVLWTMKNAFCNEFAFYVSSDEFDTIPIDKFIRNAETGKTYYVGGTLNYYF